MFHRIVSTLRLAAGIGALALLPIGSAQAGACLSGSSCDFNLSNTNLLGVTSDITVNVNNTGANTVLTVTFNGSNATNTVLGIDAFGFNSDLAILTQASGFNSANCPAQGCQMDGFGRFVQEIDSPAGNLTTFSLTLNGIETLFTDNANGGEFAVHVRFEGCSFFASDGTSNNPTLPPTSCTGPFQTVPEPGTLALLGLGVAGIGYARSRLQRR